MGGFGREVGNEIILKINYFLFHILPACKCKGIGFLEIRVTYTSVSCLLGSGN